MTIEYFDGRNANDIVITYDSEKELIDTSNKLLKALNDDCIAEVKM